MPANNQNLRKIFC